MPARRAVRALAVLADRREDAAEAGSVASDSLRRVTERQLLPSSVVSLKCLEVDEILLATGTGERPNLLPAQHGRLVAPGEVLTG